MLKEKIIYLTLLQDRAAKTSIFTAFSQNNCGFAIKAAAIVQICHNFYTIFVTFFKKNKKTLPILI